MYLISLYFDEKTTKRMRSYIDQIARRTGNHAMIQGKVPPHITLSAFYADDEEKAVEIFRAYVENLRGLGIGEGKVTWCSVGTFLPHTIYLSLVLNKYLYKLADEVYRQVSKVSGVRVHERYRPFGWFPHSTMAKMLTPDEMKIAFAVLQEQFKMFEGTGVAVGLAQTNPYRDICMIHLNRDA